MKSLNPSPALFLVAFLFAFSFHYTFQSQAQCYTIVDWELTPLPSLDNPDFNVTDTVDLCVEVYEDFSSDWLQGVSLSLPIGWELVSATSNVNCGNGNWVFVENPNVELIPWLSSGYYFDANNDGNPFNNWGSPTCSAVTFCFQVRMVGLTVEELNDLNDISKFAVSVVGDGMLQPGWWGPTCSFEDVSHYFETDIPPFYIGQELAGEFELSTTSCVPQSVEIELWETGTEVVAETHLVSVNADGTFSTVINTSGQFDIRLKGANLLSEKILAVNLDGGLTTLDAISINPGDINGDNQVNVLDVSNLSSGFGLQDDDLYFNASSDLNCDGSINVLDISILSARFGMIGE